MSAVSASDEDAAKSVLQEKLRSQVKDKWETPLCVISCPAGFSLSSLIEKASSDVVKDKPVLRWSGDEVWMNGFWDALVAYFAKTAASENIVFLQNIKKAKQDYTKMVLPDEEPRALIERMRASFMKGSSHRAEWRLWLRFTALMEKIYHENIFDKAKYGINLSSANRQKYEANGFDFESFWITHVASDPKGEPWSTLQEKVRHKETQTAKERAFLREMESLSADYVDIYQDIATLAEVSLKEAQTTYPDLAALIKLLEPDMQPDMPEHEIITNWYAFVAKMKKVYDDVEEIVKKETEEEKPFLTEYSFEEFWKKELINPNIDPWDESYREIVKLLGSNAEGGKSLLIQTDAFKAWVADKTTGFDSFVRAKLKAAIQEASTKKEVALEATATQALEIFEAGDIVAYKVYKVLARKGDGKKGWDIWKKGSAKDIRIWLRFGERGYDESQKSDAAFKEWFLGQPRWADAADRGKKAYEAWQVDTAHYDAFINDPEDYETWKSIHECKGAAAILHSTKSLCQQKYFEIFRKDYLAKCESMTTEAFKIYKKAYDGCESCATDEAKQVAAKAAYDAWIDAYVWDASASAHIHPQNIMIRHKHQSYPGYKSYHPQHGVSYSSKPYKGAQAHEQYENIIPRNDLAFDEYKPHHRHRHLQDVGYSSIDTRESGVIALVLGVMIFMIGCRCVYWLVKAAIGHYFTWLERKKRVDCEEVDENDERNLEYV